MQTARFAFSLAVALMGWQLDARAGGITGNAFNLPVGETSKKIGATETLQLTVTRFPDNAKVEILDMAGNPFPVDRIVGDRVSFTGPEFAFTLKAIGSASESRLVNIQFFRPEVGSDDFPTQFLQGVAIANDPKKTLSLDVVVPRSSDMQRQYTHCERIECRPRCCLFRCFR